MSLTGMYMLNSQRFDENKVNRSLELLYTNRRDEFRELSKELLPEKALLSMTNWKEFVLNFSLDVEESFKTWTGESELFANSPQKSLTLLRQLAHGKTSMNQLVHLLNLSYSISLEFKEIYRRLR
tara:strand:+ start:103 stop:477 length:375 start_codon:yes stop_codon:yes gene_type:complete